jgi:cytochrome c biogenesis protein
MQHYTGLEISHEPGQWYIWAGVLLMGAGLAVAFYMVHIRFWIMPAENKDGELVLWIGGSANKNKDRFEEKYNELVEAIRQELGIREVPATEEEPEVAHV